MNVWWLQAQLTQINMLLKLGQVVVVNKLGKFLADKPIAQSIVLCHIATIKRKRR